MKAAKTRAVLRPLSRNLEEVCPACGEEIKYSARTPSRYRREAIANIYWRGKWHRIEHWHYVCYLRAGMPHGQPPELSDDDLALFHRVTYRYAESRHHSVLLEALIRNYHATKEPA